MMHGLKPYPEYRDSDLSWLGKIPSHWSEQPGLAVFREKKEKNSGLREQRVLSLSYGRIVIKPVDKLHGLVPDSFETYQIVSPGDIIIRSTDLQNDWDSLRVGLVRDRGIITSAYLCFKNLGSFVPEFAYVLLHSYDLQKFFYGLGSGLRQNLAFGDFKRLPFPIPPPDEQADIVRFVDHANSAFERFLRSKMRELALVTELLLTVTEQALQSPRARLLRIATAAEVIWRPIERHANQSYTPIGLYNRGRGIFHKLSTEGADLGDSNFFWIKKGDLVLSGQFAWEGAVALAQAQDDGCVASHRYPILRGRNGYASSEMLLAFLRTPYGTLLLDHHSRGAAGRNRPLNARTLLKEKIPIPPPPEQVRVAELLAHEYSVAQRLAKAVRLVNEYRARLVSDVVTGKLDVRAVVNWLPAESDQVEPIIDDVEPEEELGELVASADAT